MRTLVHLSDLHFGRVDPAIIEPLIATINDLKPHLIAVSGDLTQRARNEQFKQAREFLDRLPAPQVVVPGNHDVPLHNVFARFATPFDKYRRWIGDDLEPVYEDDEMVVMGINTARRLTIKDGRINRRQIAEMRERLCGYEDAMMKIIVTHHPFDLPAGADAGDRVGRARLALEMLAECGADMFLAGHLHLGHTGKTAMRYPAGDRNAIIVQAGTATSTRGRGELNSFNVIRIEADEIRVERLAWQAERVTFDLASVDRFHNTPAGWQRLPASP
ncbi:MAG TPA: metallophosphoesterase family protein [Blastocatellia bacterium]